MEREAAKRLIRQTLEQPFNRDQFLVFIKNLLNHIEVAPFTYRGNYIFADFQDYVDTLERIGKYEDSDGNKLDVLVVHLKKTTSLERARASQRKFVAKYLKGSRGNELKDAALVAFVSPNEEDWRFSFVKMDYKIETTEKGRVKVKEEFTPARRYSFLVGKNENSHTAQSQLLPILENTDQDPTIRSIEERFSIEKVTKEFFEQYRELYHKVKDALDKLVTKDKDIQADFEEKGVDTVDFAKKLLGQIVFLYFLQKKGWFGVKRKAAWGTGSKHFLRELFQAKHGQYKNFFNDILEPLFYEALADGERKEDYYSRFDCRIPFLNGGLFDPLNNYDWVNTDILLPNELFSNDGKTKQGDTGTGILDVLDRYNFTVKEDEPLEKEVAIDPEMLGKVFENLLEVKDRKSKGTYYTPREIVHYMCQESLINYLATELHGTVPREDIETLIKHGETALENDALVGERGEERGRYKYKLPKSVRDNAQVIDEKLADIKVCDPAVGSGAFLVGMMSEIIRTRMVLTEFVDTDSERSPYDLKRHAIQNSLYGVDIDLGAVEIAKLRLWLSLIVDEESYKHIKPLPNLDYKIMQGNSLLEEYEGIKLIDERFFEKPEDKAAIRERLERDQSQIQRDYIQLDAAGRLTRVKKAEFNKRLKALEKHLKEIDKPRSNGLDNLGIFGKTEAQSKAERMRELHETFFSVYNKRQKDQVKKQIDSLTWDLIEATLKQHGKSEKLEEVRRFQQTNTQPFFLWRLNFADAFAERGGFDVVIGNPPYGFRNVLSKEEKNFFRKQKGITFPSGDVSELFVQFGVNTICRVDGIVSFIIPKKSLYGESWTNVRQFWREKSLRFLMDASKAFEKVLLEQVAFGLQKNDEEAPIIVGHLDQVNDSIRIVGKYQKSTVFSCFGTVYMYVPSLPQSLNDKMSNAKSTYVQEKAEARIGLSNLTKHLTFEPHGAERCVKGIDIVPFGLKRLRYVRKSALRSVKPERLALYRRPKIIVQEIIAHIEKPLPHIKIMGFYDTEGLLLNDTAVAIICDDTFLDPRFLLGLLQSKLINWYCYNVIYNRAIRTMHLINYYIGQIPLPNIRKNSQTSIIALVEKAHAMQKRTDKSFDRSKDSDIDVIMRTIDQHVYELYGLTPEEIEIVEGETNKKESS